MMIRKTIVCGLIALLVLCITPVSAWCVLEDSYEEDDPMFHDFPSVLPQNPVFSTPKDTPLTVNEIMCSADILGYAMDPVSETSHGSIVFHKSLNGLELVYDGQFTYTPDPGFTGWDNFTFGCRYDSDPYGYCYGPTTTAKIYVVDNSIPEFPSVFLPVTLIMGMLGAIWLINGTREH